MATDSYLADELPASVPAPEMDESPIAASRGTILVVEDDPRLQKVLRRIFADEHYTVFVAGDGQKIGRASCRERVSSPV